MARPLRMEYPGGIYHVMVRGDGGRWVFETEGDNRAMLRRLGEVCASHGWQLHAWVLMGNHFHLLLETPQANLVSGMKWLLGTFSQGWNRVRSRHGHVFQGRYRATPVSGGEAHYFRIAADYIHLNPARAGLAGGEHGPLVAYRWSSLRDYASGKGPAWLQMDRVLRAFDLSQDGRGRRAYVERVEARARADGGKFSAEVSEAMRRGWYLGSESFKDWLLKVMERPVVGRRGSVSGPAVRDRSLHEAERLVAEGAALVGFAGDEDSLARIAKGDRRKVLVATVVKRRSIASNDWIAKRLAMGAAGSVSRLVGDALRDEEMVGEVMSLEGKLKCDD